MQQVFPRLYVGSGLDFGELQAMPSWYDTWSIVHAAKDPYHRAALGYTSRAAPKDKDYYYVVYGLFSCELAMNMVDATNPTFFNAREMIVPALEYIDVTMSQKRYVLVHCNRGESRGPMMALLYLAIYCDDILPETSYQEAKAAFELLYPAFSPGLGIEQHVRDHWRNYMSMRLPASVQ